MASRDGNGWVRCSLGHRHWGKFGAAGLLAYAGEPDETKILLQRRVAWSHYGGTWGLPGGAADSHETPVEAALREAAEECGVPPDAVVVHGIYTDDHGGWAYHTVFARAAAPFAAYPASEETDDVDWVPADRAAELDLHPGLAAHWAELRAGLLTYAGPPGDLRVLLQRRAWWSHHGGTWGLPGGAADSHETPVAAALREAAEECGVPSDAVTVRGIFDDDHGGWAYRTVFASAPAPFPVLPDSDETDEVTWAPADQVARLNLHPGLAAHWAELRGGLAPLTVIVDAANVIGSRPDGWWRDRAGAARRLVSGLGTLAVRGVPDVPPELGLPVPARWFPEIVVVLEGQARGAVAAETGVRISNAPGSGDDTIAAVAAETAGDRLVVTADRELRARCEAAGAHVTGPRWLTGQLDA